MKTTSLAAALALLCFTGGCDVRAKAQARRDHADMEARMAALEMRLDELDEENRRLRGLLDAFAKNGSEPLSDSASGGSPQGCTGGDGIYRISRTRVDALFADTSALASQARLVPSFENGKSTGFKLFSIRPSSVYASCGLQNGDTLKSVNGMDIDTPDKALDAYARAKGSDNVVVGIVRQGKPLTVTIDVDP